MVQAAVARLKYPKRMRLPLTRVCALFAPAETGSPVLVSVSSRRRERSYARRDDLFGTPFVVMNDHAFLEAGLVLRWTGVVFCPSVL